MAIIEAEKSTQRPSQHPILLALLVEKNRGQQLNQGKILRMYPIVY